MDPHASRKNPLNHPVTSISARVWFNGDIRDKRTWRANESMVLNPSVSMATRLVSLRFLFHLFLGLFGLIG
jgi:hypothetical protein